MQAFLPLHGLVHTGELVANRGQVLHVREIIGSGCLEEMREITGRGFICRSDYGGCIELFGVNYSCEQGFKFVPLPRELYEVRVHAFVLDKDRIEVKILLNFLSHWLPLVLKVNFGKKCIQECFWSHPQLYRMVYDLSRRLFIKGVLVCIRLLTHSTLFFRAFFLAYVNGLQHISGLLNLPHTLLPSIVGGYLKFRARRLIPLLFEFEYLCRQRTLFVLDGVDGRPQVAHFRCPRLLSGLVLRYRVIVQGRVVFNSEVVMDR